MDDWKLVVAVTSLLLSGFALYRTTSIQRAALSAAAADRALQRFSRFNEILFRQPELHPVFSQGLDALKASLSPGEFATAKAFAWFVLNQMEGVYMDYHTGQLAPVSFQCYDTWFRFRMGKGGSMRDFVLRKNGEGFQYFAEPYQTYLRDVLNVK